MEQQKQDRPKDPMVNFRSVKTHFEEEGKTRIELYLGGSAQDGNAQVQNLIDFLTNLLDNEKGAKLDLYIRPRVQKQTNRVFDAAFCFIKPVQEAPAFGSRQNNRPTQVTAAQAETAKSRVQKVRETFEA